VSLSCPTCPDQPLHVLTLRGIHVDQCERCRGQWLEHGELEQLAPGWKTDSLLASLRGAPGRCYKAGHAIPVEQEHCTQCASPRARCPECAEPLSQVKTTACSVDVCGRCRGLWLDSSELVALRRARPNVVGAAAVGAAAAVATAAVVSSMSGPAPAPGYQSSQVGWQVAGDVVEESVELALTSEPGLTGAVELGDAVVEAGGGLLEFVSSGLDTGVELVVGLIGALFD